VGDSFTEQETSPSLPPCRSESAGVVEAVAAATVGGAPESERMTAA